MGLIVLFHPEVCEDSTRVIQKHFEEGSRIGQGKAVVLHRGVRWGPIRFQTTDSRIGTELCVFPLGHGHTQLPKYTLLGTSPTVKGPVRRLERKGPGWLVSRPGLSSHSSQKRERFKVADTTATLCSLREPECV